MTRSTSDFLAITWGTSRARDTAGWPICRLDVNSTDKRFRCIGGGYDMVGTVVGEWLQATYQSRLLKLDPEAQKLYGFRRIHIGGIPRVRLDGASGINAMQRIAEAMGIALASVCNRRGHTIGFTVTDYGSAEALQLAQK